MTKLLIAFCLFMAPKAALAQDFLSEPDPNAAPTVGAPTTANPDEEGISIGAARDPASTPPLSLTKKNYPGAADEEDLHVLPTLPEAAMKTDARSIQREVYKALYNQELKDRDAPVEE